MTIFNLSASRSPVSRSHGFSLVEVMIVIVIIGILAAVAVPVFTNNVNKAKQTEADAALASIRKQLTIYKCEYGNYPKDNNNDYVIAADWASIKPGELTGKYFSDSSYTYVSQNHQTYLLTCAKGSVLESNRTLNDEGEFAWE